MWDGGGKEKEGEKSVGSVTSTPTIGKEHAAFKDWNIASMKARNWSVLFAVLAHVSRTLSDMW